MKRLGLFVVLGLVLGSICGCALFGITHDAEGNPVSDGKGGIVGGVVGTFFPWATTLIAGAAGVYADLKRRNWKAAFTSTSKALEDFKATPEGKKVWDALKEKLGESQATAAIQGFVDKYLEKLKT